MTFRKQPLPAMLPLPIRFTQQQADALRALRAIDGLSIQEHVRRATDAYLATFDLAKIARARARLERQKNFTAGIEG